MNFLTSQTFQNLSKAFAGESQARNRYTFFASAAKKDGHQHIAAVFEATGANEREHAKVFYKLLSTHAQGETDVIHVDADYPLVYKDTIANLRAAAAGEKEEWTVIYSQFGDVAEQEGFSDVAKAFRKIAEVEKHHEARFSQLAAALEQGNLYRQESTTSWKCMNCGYVHEGTAAPDTCPACFHPQGYFVQLPEQY